MASRIRRILVALAAAWALASLLVLATLGTLLMSRETEYAVGPSPEMILAVERDAPTLDATPLMDRDQMLYTLASHKQ